MRMIARTRTKTVASRRNAEPKVFKKTKLEARLVASVTLDAIRLAVMIGALSFRDLRRL